MRPVHKLAPARAVAAAAVIVFSGLLLIGARAYARQISAASQQSASASAAGVHAGDSANAGATLGSGQASGSVSSAAGASGLHDDARASSSGSAYAAEKMRPVRGELQGKLDAKSARPGDQVVVKTTQKSMLADGTEIPKGTRLVGHVTEAQAHVKGHAESQLGIVFDRAELKDGRSIPIHSAIESIAPPSAMAEMAGDDDLSMSGPVAAGGGPVMAAGSGRAGGGLLGGGGAALGGVAQTAGRVGGGLDSTAGSAAGSVASQTTAGLDRGLHGATGAAGDVAMHSTTIPGLMLSGDATGSASGVLSAANRNVHLDSGTQMVLGVAAAR
ncbi:MAG TPA: hypothetical protein VKU93_04010 [Terracidiphilus sp.]|nr:hypothetical protein [Terracidiphilus sp.]